MCVERVTSSNADAALLENSDRLLSVLHGVEAEIEAAREKYFVVCRALDPSQYGFCCKRFLLFVKKSMCKCSSDKDLESFLDSIFASFKNKNAKEDLFSLLSEYGMAEGPPAGDSDACGCTEMEPLVCGRHRCRCTQCKSTISVSADIGKRLECRWARRHAKWLSAARLTTLPEMTAATQSVVACSSSPRVRHMLRVLAADDPEFTAKGVLDIGQNIDFSQARKDGQLGAVTTSSNIYVAGSFRQCLEPATLARLMGRSASGLSEISRVNNKLAKKLIVNTLHVPLLALLVTSLLHTLK
ncbi:unnamed protein product [Symbiodinium sp. CCMP2592]|nr:unnamed protein product [Symbiodinium sp. CCMP2592]